MSRRCVGGKYLGMGVRCVGMGRICVDFWPEMGICSAQVKKITV